jgi:NAD(P)H-hydrate epimerase
MCLPGISAVQMIEVDRIMVNELKVPIELMMEHAGLSLARLAVGLSNRENPEFCVIAGSGNNGGGGLVAARRMVNWNYDVTVIIPKGFPSLGEVPMAQLIRLQSMGIDAEDIIPRSFPENVTILDAFIGYGYTKRDDAITSLVFDSIRSHRRVISLDAPSGLDVTTGVSYSGIHPIATMTLAFVKMGLLKASPQEVGELYICDIGVPADIYLNRLGIHWSEPFDAKAIDNLSDAFAADPLNKVQLSHSYNYQCWNVSREK